MKKYLSYFFSCLIVAIIFFFSFNIFLKLYFNQRFYSLPNLIGLTMNDVEKIELIDKIQINVAGNEYSHLPAGTIFRQSPNPDKLVKENRVVDVWVSRGEDGIVIPDYSNLNFIDIESSLQKEGVQIKNISYVESALPYNSVVTTTPKAGEFAKKTDGISFLLSRSNAVSQVIVPDVVGFTIGEAIEMITDLNLIVGNIEEKYIPNFEQGIVIDASNINDSVPTGTIINLVVSF